MKKIDALLEAYGEGHQSVLNRRIHYFCVPLIFFSVLGLLYSIPVYRLFTSVFEPSVTKHINLASLLVLLALPYYFSLSFKLALNMLFVSLVALAVIHVIELSHVAPLWLIMGALFVIGWVGQFIGHKHEGNKPSFFDDVKFFLIGPAWILSHLYKRLGIRF